MDIGVHVEALQCTAVSSEQADVLGKAIAQLVDAAGIGRQYKVMGATSWRDAQEAWRFTTAGEVVAQDTPTDKNTEGRSTMPAA